MFYYGPKSKKNFFCGGGEGEGAGGGDGVGGGARVSKFFITEDPNLKKKKVILNYPKSAAMGFFPRDSRTSSKQPW